MISTEMQIETMREWSNRQIIINNDAYNISFFKRKYLFDKEKYSKVNTNSKYEFLQCTRFITIDFTDKMVAPENARFNQEKIKRSLDYIYNRIVEETCGKEKKYLKGVNI